MPDAYLAKPMERSDAFALAGERITRYLIVRLNARSLTFTSSTALVHPDTGERIEIGFAQVDFEMLRRFPELRRIDQIEIVIVGDRVRAFIVPTT